MKIKLTLSAIIFFSITNLFSQTNLNSYKYIIVPNKFNFLNEENQYQINALTQFLFKKHGFTALMENEALPEDVSKNGCMALRSNVLKDPGFFKTKLKIELKDCNGKIVYTSKAGESREKEYKKAYNFALRDAFKNLDALHYSYQPENNNLLTSNKTENNEKTTSEIEALKSEIKKLKQENLVTTSTTASQNSTSPVSSTNSTSTHKKEFTGVLYAQPITNGFQLVDTSPKKIMVLLKTAKPNFFIVKDKNAVVYPENELWIYSETSEKDFNSYPINIKF